jgi:hypothetical protein
VLVIFPKMEQNILGQMCAHDRKAEHFDRIINKLSHMLLSAAQKLSNHKVNAAVAEVGDVFNYCGSCTINFELSPIITLDANNLMLSISLCIII